MVFHFFFLLRDNEGYQYFKSAHASIKIGKLILAVCAVKMDPFLTNHSSVVTERYGKNNMRIRI